MYRKVINTLAILKERGFIKQCTGGEGEDLEKLMSHSKITYYIGFDPTADSLHVGSLVPIMAIAHLQQDGHIPIVIIGGGTTMIGDPSGKTEMRRIMTQDEIETNGGKILEQLKRYIEFGNSENSENAGIFLNNAEWLLDLNYIEFMRDIGRYFKVNEMIKNETYRQRLEREEGLSFIEFNYQLLQAYDFLILFDKYNCVLQMGGDDQWGNILAGIDLVRRTRFQNVCGLTFPLLTTARGQKMGKTESGTIWLDSNKTSPYEFYQYWINTDDRDVIKFLALFTFLPMDEIDELKKLTGEDIRKAKEILAYEVTKLAHSEMEAKKAQESSKVLFAKNSGGDLSAVPTTVMNRERFVNGISVIDLFFETSLITTKTAARRLIEQGGAYVNGKKITINMIVTEDYLENNILLLRSGKKNYHQIIVTEDTMKPCGEIKHHAVD